MNELTIEQKENIKHYIEKFKKHSI